MGAQELHDSAGEIAHAWAGFPVLDRCLHDINRHFREFDQLLWKDVDCSEQLGRRRRGDGQAHLVAPITAPVGAAALLIGALLCSTTTDSLCRCLGGWGFWDTAGLFSLGGSLRSWWRPIA